MMPMPYGSFSLQLIALTAGVALFIWSLNSDDKGAGLGRLLGFLIMILALVSVICTIYMSVRFWMQPAGVYEVIQMQDQMKESTTPAAETPKEKPAHKKK